MGWSIFRGWHGDRKSGTSKRDKNYTLQWSTGKGPTRKKHRKSLDTSSLTAAKIKAAKWMERLELGLPMEEDERPESAASLVQLAGTWRGSLEAAGRLARDCKTLETRVVHVCDLAGWKTPADIHHAGMEDALVKLAAEGQSPQTCNHYLSNVKQFVGWLVKRDALKKNPIADLRKRQVRGKETHARRALSDDEARALLAATLKGKPWRQFSPIDRYWIYSLAMWTGLRAEELGSLEPSSFDWVRNTIHLPGADTKNANDAALPIAGEIREGLRTYLEGRTGNIWPGLEHARAADMLKRDLAAAGIAAKDSKGRHADFHALRHTFGTRLSRAGVSPKVAQRLMRHSDIRLTMELYTHLEADEHRTALDTLAPLFAPATSAPQGAAVQSETVPETKKPPKR